MMDHTTVTALLRRLEKGELGGDVQKELPGPYCCCEATAFPLRMIEGLVKDFHAASICPDDFPGCHSLSPVQIYGDGNCLFRFASVLAIVKQDDHLEHRRRVALELSMHARFYSERMAQLASSASAQSRSPHPFSASSLLQSTLGETGDAVFVASKKSGRTNSEAYEAALHAETKSLAIPGRYAGLQHIWALASVLQVSIRSVYPNVNAEMRHLFNNVLHPRVLAADKPGADVMKHIMWTHLTSRQHLTSAWALAAKPLCASLASRQAQGPA